MSLLNGVMAKMLRNLLWVFALSLLAVSASGNQDTVDLFVVDYPPYAIIDSEGVITGIDVDVTKAAFAAVGVKANIGYAPWKRIIKSLQHGTMSGTISCSKREGRDEYIHFSQPLSEIRQVAVIKKGTQLNDVNVLNDLKKYRVAAVDGWGIQKQLSAAEIPHKTSPDISGGINALLYRDVDIFFNGWIPTQFQAAQLGVSQHIVSHVLSDQKGTKLYLCLSKHSVNTSVLIERFNRGLEKIKQSGEYQRIYEHYLQ